MRFSLNSSPIITQRHTTLIVSLFEDGSLTSSASKVDKACHGLIHKLYKQGQCQGKLGTTTALYSLPGTQLDHVIVVGCGKNRSLTAGNFRKIIASSIKSLPTTATNSVLLCLTELAVEQQDIPWKIQQLIEVSTHTLYQFNQFKTQKEPCQLKELQIHAEMNSHNKKALAQGVGVAEAVTYTKNIANLPSNICTPSYLAKEARILSAQYKTMNVKVLEEAAMRKLGMGAMLAVAKGSAEKPKLICLHYHGAPKQQAPIVLVGKGITFDTGGISLKTADGMVGMKYDMCGAATVLGTLKAVAQLKLPINLIGVLATAENMPSGTASKPEDIVTSLSGQTIEILNTDAEGRLVLCDALTYCERFKPDVVIDIATLTGAVLIALGTHASALLTNHAPLAQDLLTAAEQSYDRVWQMPLWDDYQEQLKSPFADMANVGGRFAGVITAACFLSRFTKKFHWAHLDVAGTAAMMMGNQERMATGRPVPLLVQYLINRKR
ncbi:MAG: leucyl aminopeptidase [Gammaproteobacteria bacterium RIFCSPHIGHO2_12_FULL_41_20]|nr:MAG: leucyl aminopeptidase [Gammaproteobacteria bacterium RIFCSPHIGHO2_12_FULL_41_20]